MRLPVLTVVLLLAACAPQPPRTITAAAPSPSPKPSVSPTTSMSDSCPTKEFATPWNGNPDGVLVPVEGVVSITDCGSPQSDGDNKTLTRRVGEVVALLNKLPGDRRKQPVGGTLRGVSTWSLLVRYADREPLHVLGDFNHDQVSANGALKTYLDSGITRQWRAAFGTFYRDQVVATTSASAVKTPACLSEMGRESWTDASLNSHWPRADIGELRIQGEPFLPLPLVVVSACRYRMEANGFRLAGSASTRDGLKAWRTVLNTEGKKPVDQCAGVRVPSAIDVVWVADVSGAVEEIRIWRRPCSEVYVSMSKTVRTSLGLVTSRWNAAAPTAALNREIDRLLG